MTLAERGARASERAGERARGSSCSRCRSKVAPAGTQSAAAARGRRAGSSWRLLAEWQLLGEEKSGRLRVIFPRERGGEWIAYRAPSLKEKTLTLWPGRRGRYRIRKDAFWVQKGHIQSTKGARERAIPYLFQDFSHLLKMPSTA